jgi:hypothetical protein
MLYSEKLPRFETEIHLYITYLKMLAVLLTGTCDLERYGDRRVVNKGQFKEAFLT